MSRNSTKKTWVELVEEDKKVHAAENAAWYAFVQKEEAEYAQRKAEKKARRAATQSLSASNATE
jgi:hypothetical protein